MSRFSLRIPDQSFFDIEKEPKVRASFRYDKIPLTDENNHARDLAQARAKHRQRIIKPLHSNLKLKKVLVDKVIMHNNSENNMKTQKGSDVSLIKANQIDHILHTIKEVTQISAFQDKRMGLKHIHPQRPIHTDHTFDPKIFKELYSPTSGVSEGQKLRDKAISLCRKKAEYQEVVAKAKNKSVVNTRVTPEKQASINKPCQKQLKNDIRFRYSNRRLLLLRTLSQIADKKDLTLMEKETDNEESIFQRNTYVEDRRISLTYICPSPKRGPSYDDLKTDCTQNGIYLTEVAEAAPIKSLNNGLTQQTQQKNVQKIYKKLSRKDSLMSNCSIINKSSELLGYNVSEIGGSLSGNIDASRAKMSEQRGSSKVLNVPKTLPNLPTRSIGSLSKILPTVPSSRIQEEKPIYKAYLQEEFRDNPSSLTMVKSNQDIMDCLNEMQKPMLRKNKSQKPISKNKGLYGISSRNSLKDERSRYDDISIRGFRKSVPVVQDETSSKVYNLLQKIHRQSPKGKRKQESSRFETSLETLEKVEESRNDTNESNMHWKIMMNKNLQDMINASYQDTQETSLAEETTSILMRYGYRDSTIFREPRDSIRAIKT